MGLQAYPNVGKIPEHVEVALIIVSRDYVFSSLKDCAEKGIKAAVVITAGFREADQEGKDIEREIKRLARESGLRICGLNCAGLANIGDEILTSMLREENRKLLAGKVGFASQSGGLMMVFAGMARDKGIGFSYIDCTDFP